MGEVTAHAHAVGTSTLPCGGDAEGRATGRPGRRRSRPAGAGRRPRAVTAVAPPPPRAVPRGSWRRPVASKNSAHSVSSGPPTAGAPRGCAGRAPRPWQPAPRPERPRPASPRAGTAGSARRSLGCGRPEQARPGALDQLKGRGRRRTAARGRRPAPCWCSWGHRRPPSPRPAAGATGAGRGRPRGRRPRCRPSARRWPRPATPGARGHRRGHPRAWPRAAGPPSTSAPAATVSSASRHQGRRSCQCSSTSRTT